MNSPPRWRVIILTFPAHHDHRAKIIVRSHCRRVVWRRYLQSGLFFHCPYSRPRPFAPCCLARAFLRIVINRNSPLFHPLLLRPTANCELRLLPRPRPDRPHQLLSLLPLPLSLLPTTVAATASATPCPYPQSQHALPDLTAGLLRLFSDRSVDLFGSKSVSHSYKRVRNFKDNINANLLCP